MASFAFSVIMALFAGLAHGITLTSDYSCGRLNSNITMTFVLKQEPTYLQWKFRKSPRSLPSVICTWNQPDQLECWGTYRRRVQVYKNGTLVLGLIRAADSGWYYLHAKFSQGRDIYRNVQLYVFASSSQMVQSLLPLLLVLMLLKCSL